MLPYTNFPHIAQHRLYVALPVPEQLPYSDFDFATGLGMRLYCPTYLVKVNVHILCDVLHQEHWYILTQGVCFMSVSMNLSHQASVKTCISQTAPHIHQRNLRELC